MLNTTMTLEEHNVCGWAHSLLWRCSNLHQPGIWAKLLTDCWRSSLQYPCHDDHLRTHRCLQVWWQRKMTALVSAVKEYFVSWGFLSFVSQVLQGVKMGNTRLWWHQDENTSVQETLYCMQLQKTSLATSSKSLKSRRKLIINNQSNTWSVFVLRLVLHLMTDHDLSSVSGISKYFSLKCCLEERWWLSCTSLR